MQSFVITDESQWSSLSSSWNSLARANPMLSTDWLCAWWRHFGASHQLRIFVAVDDDRLLGFLPCYEHETRLGKQLRFLGSGTVCSDYLGAVVDPSHPSIAYSLLNECMQQSISSNEVEGTAF